MKVNNLNELPTQFLRNIVKDTLQESGNLEYEDLSEKIFSKLLETEEPSNNDVIVFDNVLTALVESGRVHYLHSNYSFNEDFVDNLEEELYVLDNSTSQKLNIDGGFEPKYSVGSERYNIWNTFDVGQEVTVNLIAEPDNKFDNNAIAICLNNSPIAYLARSDAKEYKPIVDNLAELDISLELTGIVSENPLMPGYKYFELAPLEPKEIIGLI